MLDKKILANIESKIIVLNDPFPNTIIENFLPGHLREPILLYLGDTSKKVLVMEEKYFNKKYNPSN